MLYNKEKKKIKTDIDCDNCKYFDKYYKDCKGFGICCFEYDEKTMTAFDPVTKLPIKLD